ncbi:MAG TPA: DUF2779 domain-containing protein, partial [bacterium]|nr:DUF2779 domain-containing protein [bacterium]
YLQEQGREVGRLARGLYPGGVEIPAGPQQPALALRQTRAAVDTGALALFEAAAQGGDAFARADILHRQDPENAWDLLEVKASGRKDAADLAGGPEDFLWDLAFQRHAFASAGYAMGRSRLALVNKDYIRQGPVDPAAFFTVTDLSQAVEALQAKVPALLRAMAKAGQSAAAPERAIGAHCSLPHACPFQGQCWPKPAADSVFNLRSLPQSRKLALFHAGRRSFSQLGREKLGDWQAKQVKAQRSGKPFIDKAKIRGFLAGLRYPLFHLDFETLNTAIPPFDGVRPFAQTAFQFSLHVQSAPGARPAHFDYLPKDASDPRGPLLQSLLELLGDQGTILAYNAPFEKGRLEDLAAAFPQRREEVEAALRRFQDLITPFKNGWLVHPAFEGSVSIKAVLPALVPSMSYDGLAVADGGGAIRAYAEFLRPGTTAKRRREIREDLLEYCGQDTLAMVKVLEALERL